jgi:tRNA G18 (ribose-2'-O)-methylase SpoU
MVGKINSLNASVAAAIVIYEVFRQKNRWYNV